MEASSPWMLLASGANLNLYRFQCLNFASLHEPLTYEFGYTSAQGSFSLTSIVHFLDMYLPSGAVKVFVNVKVSRLFLQPLLLHLVKTSQNYQVA